MTRGSQGMAEPPEGALAGEDVPRENESDELHRAMVEAFANRLRAHPAYTDRPDSELRELAREKLARVT